MKRLIVIVCVLFLLLGAQQALACVGWDCFSCNQQQEMLVNIWNKLCQSQQQSLWNNIVNNNKILNEIANNPEFINTITVNPSIINSPEFNVSSSSSAVASPVIPIDNSPSIEFKVPRNFPQLPPELEQQYSYSFGAIYLKSYLDKEEKKILNSMLGAVPWEGKSLSRETIKKNTIGKWDLNIKKVLNEFPIFELFLRGDKGVSNFKAKIEYNEDAPPVVNPATSMKFIRKLEDGIYYQVVDRSELEQAGWAIGAQTVINGVPGIWLSPLKWVGYSLLMESTGYEYGAVVECYRSNVLEASGKNLQMGGSGNFMPGAREQNAYNMLMNLGKGSGQNWESQKFDLVVAGLKRMKLDAPTLIKPAPPAPPAVVEKKPEVIIQEKVMQVPVTVKDFSDLVPSLTSIHFELNSAAIKDFEVAGIKFENRKALDDANAKMKSLLPLLEKNPNLKVYLVGYNCDYGPKGTFPTKTKEGKAFSNNEAYNRGGLGGERGQSVGKDLVKTLLGSGMDKKLADRFLVASAGFNENDKFHFDLSHLKDKLNPKDYDELLRTMQRRVDIVAGFDISTAKLLTVPNLPK